MQGVPLTPRRLNLHPLLAIIPGRPREVVLVPLSAVLVTSLGPGKTAIYILTRHLTSVQVRIDLELR